MVLNDHAAGRVAMAAVQYLAIGQDFEAVLPSGEVLRWETGDPLTRAELRVEFDSMVRWYREQDAAGHRYVTGKPLLQGNPT